MKEIFWRVIAIVSGIYIFIPEFTDFIPLIGWLDEAFAIIILNYALKKLNINIPDFIKRKILVK